MKSQKVARTFGPRPSASWKGVKAAPPTYEGLAKTAVEEVDLRAVQNDGHIGLENLTKTAHSI